MCLEETVSRGEIIKSFQAPSPPYFHFRGQLFHVKHKFEAACQSPINAPDCFT